MSIAFVCFGCTIPLITASAIKLSVCSGVGGCVCPISSSIILMYTASLAMMYNPARSTLVADGMTSLMMCAILSTSLKLFGGMVVLPNRKKCQPAPVRDWGLLR